MRKPTKTTDKQSMGREGERMAREYLQQKGYELVQQNYRYRHFEIDLILRNKEMMIFVEVKYRKSNQFGFPEEFVSNHQKQSILSAADAYLHTSQWAGVIRFDIVAIDATDGITHFEDAFY